MQEKVSVCPNQCEGGHANRQGEYVLEAAELASLGDPIAEDALTRRCTYCGCVYLPTDPPTILGFKDEEPAGRVSWVPAHRRWRESSR